MYAIRSYYVLVLWLWIFPIAATSSLSAATYPIRQPVIEKAFDSPFTRIVLFRISSSYNFV